MESKAHSTSAVHSNNSEVKGIEVLTFFNAELYKVKGAESTFRTSGILSVLYIPYYKRVLLYLNDFTYCVLKRLPVVASPKAEAQTRVYTFPQYNNSGYKIKLSKIEFVESIANFETILKNNSRFSYEGESLTAKRDLSPHHDQLHHYDEEHTGDYKEKSLESSTASVSSMSASGMKLSKKDKVKKAFHKVFDSFKHRSWDQKNNVNLSKVKSYEDLIRTDVDPHLVHEIHAKDVERVIVRSKDIAKKNGYLIDERGAIMDSSVGVSRTSVVTESGEANLGSIPVTQSVRVSGQKVEQVDIVQVNRTIEELVAREAAILKEIDEVRFAQLQERKIQEQHRTNELYYVQKERELRDTMRSVHQQTTIQEVKQRESVFLKEIERRDAAIVEQARLREIERAEFERRQQALIAEIERRLAELRLKEAMSEDEAAEFRVREAELMTIVQRRDAEKQKLELRQAALLKEAQDREAEILRREKLNETERAEIARRDHQIEVELEARLVELKRKEQLTEAEREEMLNREEELRRLVELRNAEILGFRQGRVQLQAELETRLANIYNREQLLEAERAEYELRHSQLIAEAERRIAVFREKQALNEAERLELAAREEELARLTKIKEQQLLELAERQKRMTTELAARQADLQNKIRLTEAERQELINLEGSSQKAAELTQAERRAISYRLEELLQQAEAREKEIAQRSLLTEAQRAEIELKDQALEAEIQARLIELRKKEKLTEQERIELRNRQRELLRITQIKEIEFKKRSGNAEALKETEARLLAQNEALIQGHQRLSMDILRVGDKIDQVDQASIKTITTTTQVQSTL